jgi:anti-anti-sigma regulatory factor
MTGTFWTLACPDVLTVRFWRCGRTLWLRGYGGLNWRTASVLQTQIETGLAASIGGPEGSIRRLVLDLTSCDHVGGDILRTLLELSKRLTARGIEFCLVASEGSRCARSILLSGLHTQIPTFAHPDALWRHGSGRRATEASG